MANLLTGHVVGVGVTGSLRGLAANELKSAAWFRRNLAQAIIDSKRFGWPLDKQRRKAVAAEFVYRARLLRAVRGFALPS